MVEQSLASVGDDGDDTLPEIVVLAHRAALVGHALVVSGVKDVPARAHVDMSR